MIANLKNYARFGIIDYKRSTRDTKWIIDTLSVKTPSQRKPIANLSGGNQQKVILGRWLLTSPKVLLLDEPTRGIDVGAKYEIYQLMIDLAAKGNSIIFISSEMPELLGITDRILVMSNGRVAGIVNTAETNQEELLMLAAKYL
jgi:methyl-galactoside transport system ATP-binding protein